jgi:hypothetical protein
MFYRLAANRARQPAAVTPRVPQFSPTPPTQSFQSPSTPSPVVSLPDRVTLPARATLPSRNTNLPTASIAQPVQSVSRPRIPRPQPATAKPPFSKISPDGDYLYEYVYEYEDDFDSTPKLVDSIDEYDFNPLTSKVIIKIVFRGSFFHRGLF